MSRRTYYSFRTWMITIALISISAIICLTEAYGFDDPNASVQRRTDCYIDVRSDQFYPIISSEIDLQPGYFFQADGYIENVGNAYAFVEVLPGMVMLTRDSMGAPVPEPYPAPRDKYRLSYVLYQQSAADKSENGFLVYDYATYLEYRMLCDSDRNYPPHMAFWWLPQGNYDGVVVSSDRFFLSFPGSGEYFQYGSDGKPIINSDGSYNTKTHNFKVKLSVTVDFLTHAHEMGNEWLSPIFIPPRLLVGNGEYEEDIMRVFGLNTPMCDSLEWGANGLIPISPISPISLSGSFSEGASSAYIDLVRKSDSPLIYTSQPTASTTVIQGNIGGNLSVSAKVTDNSALSYQWYSNNWPGVTGGTPIPGATNPTFAIPQDLTTSVNPYYYYCVISSSGSAVDVTSNVAMVKVQGPTPSGNVIELRSSANEQLTGSTFTVLASMTTETSVAGISFFIQYDSDVVRLDNVQYLADKLDDCNSFGNNIVMKSSALNERQGDCDLVELTFTVLDDSKAATIDFTNVSTILGSTHHNGYFQRTMYDVATAVVNAEVKPKGSISKVVSKSAVLRDEVFSYTITLTNDVDATDIWRNVVLRDTLPSDLIYVSSSWVPAGISVNHAGGVLTANVGDIATGAAFTLTINVAVANTTVLGQTITNSAVAISDNDENLVDAVEIRVGQTASGGDDYTIGITAGPGGTADGGGIFETGSNITLTAAPNSAYTFEGWYEDGIRISNDQEYSFTVEKDRQLAARFTRSILYHEVALSAGYGGMAGGGGYYEEGTTVFLTAAPLEAYAFAGWYEDDEKISGDLEYCFIADKGRNLEARYIAKGEDFEDGSMIDAYPDTSGADIDYDIDYDFDDRPDVIRLYTKNRHGLLTRAEVKALLADAGVKPDDNYSIEFDKSVKTIDSNAFSMCIGLTRVDINESITGIGHHAFSFCYGLKEINVSPDNKFFSSIDGVLYNKNRTTLIAYPAGKQGGFIIPRGVANIGSYAFEGCHELTSVVIPDSVTSIAFRAFSECANLAAFTVYADNKRYSSENGVIFDRDKRFAVRYPSGKAGDYIIPKGVTGVEDYAFSNCDKLTGVVIPDSVNKIGDGAFYFCTDIKDIVVPRSIASAGTAAFIGCYNLTKVLIQDGVTNVGDYAFALCRSLKDVTLSGNLAGIGDFAFSYCTKLESIVIPNGVMSVGALAFEGSQIKTLTLPPSVTAYQVGSDNSGLKGPFSNMPVLKDIIVKPGTTAIAGNAFKYLSGNVNVFIPKSVLNISSDSGLGINTTAFVFKDSFSEEYVNKNGIPLKILPTILTEAPEQIKGYQYLPLTFTFESSDNAWLIVKPDTDWPDGLFISLVLDDKRERGEIYGALAKTGKYEVTIQATDGHDYPLKDEKTFTILIEKARTQAELDEMNKGRLIVPLGIYDSTEGIYILDVYRTNPEDKQIVFGCAFSDYIELWIDGILQKRGKDYSVREGSTVVTVYGQTLGNLDPSVDHVIAAEFKDGGNPSNQQYVVAQNFRINVVDRPSPKTQGSTGGSGKIPSGKQTVSVPPAPVPAEPEPIKATGHFIDVNEPDWFYDDVEWAYEKGFMIGVAPAIFEPYGAINPAIISVTLARVLGVDLNASDRDAGGSWYTKAFAWGSGYGLFDGLGELEHDTRLTRGQLAIVLTKLPDIAGARAGADAAESDEVFAASDQDIMTAEELEAFKLLFKLGILRGKANGVMDPHSVCLRAELAAILHRIGK